MLWVIRKLYYLKKKINGSDEHPLCFLFFGTLLAHPAFVVSLVGLEFPWGPKPFAEVVAGPLLRNNRQTSDSGSLEGHYVGVYFSAHWVSTGRRSFATIFRRPSCVALSGGIKVHRQQKQEPENRVETDRVEEEEVEARLLFASVYINGG